ncbi:MAG: TIGR00282 family metallophosphoesterase [Clostridia bacterium]|nr:TIGR00282 family metallophosphoesterase [Clostridia bacterium]
MKLLCIGDVVSNGGCSYLSKVLPAFKNERAIDFVVCNGENSADGNGITPSSARWLLDSGVDIITTGNHSFRRKEVYHFYDECEQLIRPANFPERTTPGSGYAIYDMLRYRIGVINIMGTGYLEPLGDPFDCLDKMLEKVKGCSVTVVDFHAEMTAEKRALGFYADGRVSAFVGTHTHVQTADECILPNGTGYITDLGMTGVIDSVLGVKKELAIKKFREHLPVKFETAEGECRMCGCLFDIDEKSGKARSAERISVPPHPVRGGQAAASSTRT